MKKTIQILLIIIELSCIPGAAQKISLLQMNKLSSEVNRMLQVFEKYSSYLPGETSLQEVPAEYRTIFASDSRIQNFLDPAAKDPAQVSPEEYYRYIRTHYTAGLAFEFPWNIGRMSKPIAADAQSINYFVYIPVSLKAIGLFNGQKINNVSEEYYVIIGFRLEKESISDIVIHYIQAEKPVFKYTKGSDFFIGFYAAPAFTRIHSQDIFTDDVWDAWGQAGYCAGLNLIYELNPNMGLFCGAGLSYYRSMFEVVDFNSENINEVIKLDADGDVFYEYIQATVTEKNTLTYFDIPLGIRYSLGGKKLKFLMQAGFEFSFLLSSRYSATGDSEHKGYYPDYHVVLYDLPEYGFTAQQIDVNDNWKLNEFNLSANISLGVVIPLGKKVFLNVCPYANTGLTDLGYESTKHRDDYLSISGNPGKLTTRSAGLIIEMILKL